MSSYFHCKNCNEIFDPEGDEQNYLIIDHKQETTGYDGVRDWIEETLTMQCSNCDHVDEYSSGWITDPANYE